MVTDCRQEQIVDLLESWRTWGPDRVRQLMAGKLEETLTEVMGVGDAEEQMELLAKLFRAAEDVCDQATAVASCEEAELEGIG